MYCVLLWLYHHLLDAHSQIDATTVSEKKTRLLFALAGFHQWLVDINTLLVILNIAGISQQ